MGELVGIVAVIIAALGAAASVIIVPIGLGIISVAFFPVLWSAALVAHKREKRDWEQYKLEVFGPASE